MTTPSSRLHRICALRFMIAPLLALTCAWVAAPPVQATPLAKQIAVNPFGGCDLDDAIVAANTDSAVGLCEAGDLGLDTLNLVTSFYNLVAINNSTGGQGANGLPAITSPIIIDGNGSFISRDNTAICPAGAGDFDFRIFYLSSAGDLTLQDITLENGCATDGKGGGAIYNDGGKLTLQNSRVRGNATQGIGDSNGGGIYNGGAMTLTQQSMVSANTANDAGGGIYNQGGVIISQESMVVGNLTSLGGGIYNSSGNMTVQNSTILSNTALYGGGINNDDNGRVTVQNSHILSNTGDFGGGGIQNSGVMTISQASMVAHNNTGSIGGGGIYNDSGGMIVQNSTILSNRTDGSFGGGEGGGIYNDSGSMIVQNSQILSNMAVGSFLGGGDGDGLYQIGGSSTLTASCIVGNGNTAVFHAGGSNIDAKTTGGARVVAPPARARAAATAWAAM